MTELKAYLDRTGEKQTKFAERIGTTSATISRLCSGTLKPSLELAHQIERATDGQVPTETWVADAQDAEEASEDESLVQ